MCFALNLNLLQFEFVGPPRFLLFAVLGGGTAIAIRMLPSSRPKAKAVDGSRSEFERETLRMHST